MSSDKENEEEFHLSNPQMASEEALQVHLKPLTPTSYPLGGCNSWASELSVISEDGDFQSEMPKENNLTGTQRLGISGVWVEDEEESIVSDEGGAVRVVDRSEYRQLMNFIDETMNDLEQMPSEDQGDEDSNCSAISRVKKELRGARANRALPVVEIDRGRGSIFRQGDVNTLGSLKIERDTVIEKALERAELAKERHARLVDATRATLAFAAYLTVFFCRCGLKDVVRGAGGRLCLALELTGAILICFLSTVPTESPLQRGQARLWDIILSRKTILLFTWLLVWTYIVNSVAGVSVSRKWCSPNLATKQDRALVLDEGESSAVETQLDSFSQYVAVALLREHHAGIEEDFQITETDAESNLPSVLSEDVLADFVAVLREHRAGLEEDFQRIETDAESEKPSVLLEDVLFELSRSCCSDEGNAQTPASDEEVVPEANEVRSDGKNSQTSSQVKDVQIPIEEVAPEANEVRSVLLDSILLEPSVAGENSLTSSQVKDVQISGEEVVPEANEVRSVALDNTLFEPSVDGENSQTSSQVKDVPIADEDILAKLSSTCQADGSNAQSVPSDDPDLMENVRHWVDNALKNPMSIPAFLRYSHRDQDPGDRKVISELLHTMARDTESFAEFRMSDVRKKLQDIERKMMEDLEDDSAVSDWSLVRRALGRFFAPFLGLPLVGDADEALVDTIVQVWASRE